MEYRIKIKVIEFMKSDFKNTTDISYIKTVITYIKKLDSNNLLDKIDFINLNK